MQNRIILISLLYYICFIHCSPANYYVPVENWYTIRSSGGTTTFGAQAEASIRWGLEDALNNTENILPNTDIEIEFFDNEFSTAVGISLLIDFEEQGITFVPGNPLSDVVSVTGQAAAVYGVAQLSGTANTAVLSDKVKYPFFSRSYVPSPLLGGSTVDTIKLFYSQQGRGWNRIALISSTEAYGVSLAAAFLNLIEQEPELEVATYQQYLVDTDDVTVELGEVKRSGARVIVSYAFSGYSTILEQADELGLIGDDYVYFVGPTVSGFTSTYTNSDGTINEDTVSRLRGTIGSLVYLPREGERYERYLSNWQSADPSIVPASGPGTTPPLFPTLTYDVGVLIGLVVDAADKEGLLEEKIPPEKWTELIRAQAFEGATGFITFNEVGDRPMPVALVNFIPENLTWVTVGIWEQDTGTDLLDDIDIIWNDNTTNVPNLDIRPPFDYWSCHDKKEKTDETGKEVSLHTPDGSDIDDIDSTYHCDHFIDCKNLSDESVDCPANYIVLFIVFGIITCLLIFLTCLFIFLTIFFGYIIRRRRIRSASPPFLIVICLSVIIGYCSTFAWYGKPHPVACGFQPWLLGLSVVSLISALCAKTWRIYKIFQKRMRKVIIPDSTLFCYYFIMVIPAVLILVIWTIVSTPTASIVHINDEDHYICNTGGFTGEPGGLVFFFILVGYEAVVLLFGAFLSIVTRKVPLFYNESKLIAISIYHLFFLAIIVIPVYFVLLQFNPFAAWIIRTVAILYAFTATLWLQFIPKLIGIIIIDKGKDTKIAATKSLVNIPSESVSANTGNSRN